jgi:hypothetical protein
VRPHGESEWHWISEPSDGALIAPSDVLITRAEVQPFERKLAPPRARHPAAGKQVAAHQVPA